MSDAQQLPLLYSFRRCPYAMRARLAIAYAGCPVALREVVLKDKPAALLQASPKGTVPVLVTPGGEVIDESLDVMLWALTHRDPDDLLCRQNPAGRQRADHLIAENDGPFKQALDRYKYADRYPEQPMEFHRARCERFLQHLEHRLTEQHYLASSHYSIADMAIFPFVRQLAQVDRGWFDNANFPRLRHWLQQQMESPLFARVMKKYPPWDGESLVVFPSVEG